MDGDLGGRSVDVSVYMSEIRTISTLLSWSYENEVSFQMELFHVTRINEKHRAYFSFDFRKF